MSVDGGRRTTSDTCCPSVVLEDAASNLSCARPFSFSSVMNNSNGMCPFSDQDEGLSVSAHLSGSQLGLGSFSEFPRLCAIYTIAGNTQELHTYLIRWYT